MLYHVISRHIISCHIISCHIILCKSHAMILNHLLSSFLSAFPSSFFFFFLFHLPPSLVPSIPFCSYFAIFELFLALFSFFSNYYTFFRICSNTTFNCCALLCSTVLCSDVLWLQKDLGLYLVNTFDTFHAAKTLKYPALSLAHLLRFHGNIKLNKKHQLSDWRQRPLPQDMIDYARSDTAYLHFLYDSMRRDIFKAYGREGIEAVLNASRKWCLKRYEKEPFWPLGYRKLISSEGGPPGASAANQSTTSSSSSSRVPPPTLSAAQDLVLAGQLISISISRSISISMSSLSI